MIRAFQESVIKKNAVRQLRLGCQDFRNVAETISRHATGLNVHDVADIIRELRQEGIVSQHLSQIYLTGEHR